MMGNTKLYLSGLIIEEMTIKNKALALVIILKSKKIRKMVSRKYIYILELDTKKGIIKSIKIFPDQDNMISRLPYLIHRIILQQKVNDIFHKDFFLGSKSFNIFFNYLFYSNNI